MTNHEDITVGAVYDRAVTDRAYNEWHIITCEYPPQKGGVSDYTRLVAEGLAAEGDRVHVWCPAGPEPVESGSGITVHRELGQITSRELHRVGKYLDQMPAPRRLLVQWVPHGYGYRSMNLPFCLWLWNRARVAKDDVQIMVHEPFLAFGEGSWKQDAAAAVHRIMAAIILNAASRVWISIPAWRNRLRPYLLGRRMPMEWLPVPSNVETAADPEAHVAESHFDRVTLGHFGTFGSPISTMLEPLVSPLLNGYSNRVLLLMGRGSTEFREKILGRNRSLNEQIYATGELTALDLSRWLRRCDLMIQPYPDGVSSRRGTAMAAISHGLPMVTTTGPLTETVWSQSGAVHLVRSGVPAEFLAAVEGLLAGCEKRIQMGVRARRLYMDCFDLRHTIRALRSTVGAPKSGHFGEVAAERR